MSTLNGTLDLPSTPDPKESSHLNPADNVSPIHVVAGSGESQVQQEHILSGNPPLQDPSETSTPPADSGNDSKGTTSDTSDKGKEGHEADPNDKNGGASRQRTGGNGAGLQQGPSSQAKMPKKMQRRRHGPKRKLRDWTLPSESEDGSSSASYTVGGSDDRENPSSSAKRYDQTRIVPHLKYAEEREYHKVLYESTELCAVEALVEDAEYECRRAEKLKNARASRGRSPEAHAEASYERSDIRSSEADMCKELPEEIRINSPQILPFLGQIDRDMVPARGKPYILMDRPYKPLVFFESQIRETFRKLKTRWDHVERSNEVEILNTSETSIEKGEKREGSQDTVRTEKGLLGAGHGVPNDAPAKCDVGDRDKSPFKMLDGKSDYNASRDEPEELSGSLEAFHDFQCLIEFMDDQLQPFIDFLHSGACRKVHFTNLWHLFVPGELLYFPPDDRGDSKILTGNASASLTKALGDFNQNRFQEIWEITCRSYDKPAIRGFNNDPGLFLEAFYLDFDGSKFGPIHLTHRIDAFEGVMDITSLPFYPLKFHPNSEDLKLTALARGKKLIGLTGPSHRYYVGRTLVSPPEGTADSDNKFPKLARNIDSQVIVDFKNTLVEMPAWAPYFCERNRSRWRDHYRDPDSWASRAEAQKVEAHRRKAAPAKSSSDAITSEGDELDDKDLILLPNRVFAFVMKKRGFAILNVDGLRDIKFYKDGFKDLKLPPIHKKIVSTLVHSHFRNKGAELNDEKVNRDADIVHGKGKGLVILLHGAPGVGKTSTAETIAEAYRKPLYPITCGDLGTTARQVENELEYAFHLAELWDCVLLLDEADVFLAQRTRTDVSRNGLVSVFLRVLEYFSGILFLTTNRVGAFDEAFKSRVHISLYYPPLNWKQTEAIWKMNLDRLTQKRADRNEKFKIDEDQLYDFAWQHFNKNYSRNLQWNGRQIRNAFQTAVALAEFEAHDAARDEMKNPSAIEESPPIEPHLKVEHFETVALASTEFDDYLYKLRGKTDSSRAFFDQERADQWQPAYGPRPGRAQPFSQGQRPSPQTPIAQPGVPVAHSQRPTRSPQQFSPQPPGIAYPRPQYLDPQIHDNGYDEEDDTEFGQTWQGSSSPLPQADDREGNTRWRQDSGTHQQQSRNASGRGRDPYSFPSVGGVEDY